MSTRYSHSIISVFLFLSISNAAPAQEEPSIKARQLPAYEKEKSHLKTDWLINPEGYEAALYRDAAGHLVLSNGLISRTFSITPDGATIGFENLKTGESVLRSVRPEAALTIDGKTFNIGGLTGQPIHNYLLEGWIRDMKPDEKNFHLAAFDYHPVKARFPWKRRTEWLSSDPVWPPKGIEVSFQYKAGDKTLKATPGDNDYLKKLTVTVHYALYDGIPLICKWITVDNDTGRPVMIDKFKSEILAVTDPESNVGKNQHWKEPKMSVETDYAFGGGMSSASCIGKSVFWNTDSLYLTQVNYLRKAPYLLECYPAWGPAQEVKAGDTFSTFRTWELIHDNYDRERQGLAKRKMYRIIAPWVLENPILMHVRKADNKAVKLAIDQCADVGFEMVIMTFGSGFNLEDQSPANLERMKSLADYAHGKGIALGGYSLLASRTIDAADDVVMPEGMKPTFGHSPCLGSKWGLEYFKKLYNFYEQTDQDILEHDGSYPGDVCASTKHPGHKGLRDSQWKQFKIITDFYKWCRANGIYLNVPDWYFLNGSNKTAMGYRETNWSLPRAQQEIIERQNIYDGTWGKTPSMGWMFVPLVQYHGGEKAATIEPLKDHLPHYQQRLANLFGAGVQACYRGPRLYDSPETRDVVAKWVSFYKSHRAILDSDIIHVRRPDGRDYDGIMHVNPDLEEKGLLMLYNPLGHEIKKKITVNLYYTGLDAEALVSREGGIPKAYFLNRNYEIEMEVEIPAHGETWYVIQ